MDDIAEGRCGGALVGVVCDDEPIGVDRVEQGYVGAAGRSGGGFYYVGPVQPAAGAEAGGGWGAECLSGEEVWAAGGEDRAGVSAGDGVWDKAAGHGGVSGCEDRSGWVFDTGPADGEGLGEGSFAVPAFG